MNRMEWHTQYHKEFEIGAAAEQTDERGRRNHHVCSRYKKSTKKHKNPKKNPKGNFKKKKKRERELGMDLAAQEHICIPWGSRTD